jgi:uncharacterized protein (TIGR03382 family)
MSRRLGVVLLVSLAAAPAAAERPRSVIVPHEIVEFGDVGPTGLAPYNTVYLNPCLPSGCVITPGGSNSINDRWGISQTRTLTSFPYGDEAWQQVVACVRDVMSPFNINVTTTNPGSANHWEIMIAGSPTDLGMSSGIGGVAPGGCTSTYHNNALVFAFAKVYGSGGQCGERCVNELCATAAQEIGHVWKSMDHVRVAADPMTYFGYSDRRYFQDTAAQCGSDCVNGVSPFGQTCTGTNNQSHACGCTGLQTQNSVAIIRDLFGIGAGIPPEVTITSPKFGENVAPGFAVRANATDDSGTITRVELKVNGQFVASFDSPPFVFNAPSTLADGTHKVEVIAYDPHDHAGKASVDVIIGPPCSKPADCANATDTCVGGRCVPGSGVPGGLGSACTDGTECLSGQCAGDGTNSYCVEPCLIGQCPSDYGCLETGGAPGEGVCWPGYDDGSGGCGCQTGGAGGAVPFGLAFAALALRRRRRG